MVSLLPEDFAGNAGYFVKIEFTRPPALGRRGGRAGGRRVSFHGETILRLIVLEFKCIRGRPVQPALTCCGNYTCNIAFQAKAT